MASCDHVSHVKKMLDMSACVSRRGEVTLCMHLAYAQEIFATTQNIKNILEICASYVNTRAALPFCMHSSRATPANCI